MWRREKSLRRPRIKTPSPSPQPSTTHTRAPARLSIYGSTTVLLLNVGLFFSFLILYTVGRIPWTGDQPVARPLPAHRTKQTQNKRRQTSMSYVGSEPTMPTFEGVKIFYAFDRAHSYTHTHAHTHTYIYIYIYVMETRNVFCKAGTPFWNT
jgi:hypothetical protein